MAAMTSPSEAGSNSGVLTPQANDFARWYQELVAKAELAESGAARGTMIIKPWGYAIWERIQAAFDERIKAAEADNVYFPMFIPASYLEREADHVEGFSPELAVVTHAGGEELAEPLVVRPTSETVIGDAMSRWIQGYRDLPLKLNQWANVVRWELRPRLFLRTTEFLWQEGHTAYPDWDSAMGDTLGMLTDVYRDVMESVLAMPVLCGRKTAAESFAGAEVTYTVEGLMADGKALQMGTSHNLGQNFAKAFDITYTDADGKVQHAYTTSWGVSTRVLGGLIMTHGDDAGLRLPPAIAPAQVVVVAVKDEAREAAAKLAADLTAAGVRARLDEATNQSFGRRVVDWELKGVPLRLELGPRDLEAGEVTVARRDQQGKQSHPLESVVESVPELLDDVQRSLSEQARARRDAATTDVAEPSDIEGSGLFRIGWDALGRDAGEATLDETGYSVRCLVAADGSIPDADADEGLVAYVARAY
jgi:prolyl-tRNA synthetase